MKENDLIPLINDKNNNYLLSLIINLKKIKEINNLHSILNKKK